MSRHNAREVALQMLYQMDMGENTLQVATMTLTESELSSDLRDFALSLTSGVAEYKVGLDSLINQYAKDWEISRLPSVDRSILRLGTYELMHTPTPPHIVVDEAIELAHSFAGDESPSFINGVLNGIWKGELPNSEADNNRD